MDTDEEAGAADDATEATDEDDPTELARGFPSQGCLMSLDVPSGYSTTSPGLGYEIAC